MRLAAAAAILMLTGAACSSTSSSGSGDAGLDATADYESYEAATAGCTCPSGEVELLFGPPGWCLVGPPQGSAAACGSEGCYAPCPVDAGDGGPADGQADGPADGPFEATSDAD